MISGNVINEILYVCVSVYVFVFVCLGRNDLFLRWRLLHISCKNASIDCESNGQCRTRRNINVFRKRCKNRESSSWGQKSVCDNVFIMMTIWQFGCKDNSKNACGDDGSDDVDGGDDVDIPLDSACNALYVFPDKTLRAQSENQSPRWCYQTKEKKYFSDRKSEGKKFGQKTYHQGFILLRKKRCR